MKKPDLMSDELYKLILTSDSMDEKEIEYWFDIFPSLNEDQVDRLFNILKIERRKLDELDLKFQEEMKDLELNKKNLDDFKNLSFLEKLKLLIFNK